MQHLGDFFDKYNLQEKSSFTSLLLYFLLTSALSRKEIEDGVSQLIPVNESHPLYSIHIFYILSIALVTGDQKAIDENVSKIDSNLIEDFYQKDYSISEKISLINIIFVHYKNVDAIKNNEFRKILSKSKLFRLSQNAIKLKNNSSTEVPDSISSFLGRFESLNLN